MAEAVEQEHQSLVLRLRNLPLVSSTYDLMSTTYVTTKDNHPNLQSVCGVAEKGVKCITSVVTATAMPILHKLEPQIALANNVACVGLDKIEEKLPILYQPTEKVVANASKAVVGARDAVIHSITELTTKTKGAMQDSVVMAKAIVDDNIKSVLGSRFIKFLVNRVDSALTRSEAFLEQIRMPADDELALEASTAEGFKVSQDEPGYYVRLGSLSTKARQYAYHQALFWIIDVRVRCRRALGHLQNVIDLIEYARKNMNDAQEKMSNKWVDWTQGTVEDADGKTESAEQIESRTLTIARELAQQLQTRCLSLVNKVQGLPQNIQQKACDVGAMATEVYKSFNSASSFREMPYSLLTAIKSKFRQIMDGMDDVMDYISYNVPPNWLVGPFHQKQARSHHGEQELDGGDSVTEA